MTSFQNFEQDIGDIQNLLGQIQIDPAIFIKLHTDMKLLDDSVKKKALGVKASNRDIDKFRISLTRLNTAYEQASKQVTDSKTDLAVKNFGNTLKEYEKALSLNSKKVSDNATALDEQNKIVKAQNKHRKDTMSTEERQSRIERMLSNDRIREEKNQINRLRELNAKRDAFNARMTGTDEQFSKGEMKQYGKSLRLSEDSRRSPSQRRSAGIAANLVGDVPGKVLSRIRTTAAGATDKDQNLFQQLQDLKTFQSGKQLKTTKQKALDIADVRQTKSPLLRIYKAMELESKSPKSKLIIANIFNKVLTNPIKLASKVATTVVKEAFIGMLNAPFLILKKIGTSFSNVFGDTFTLLTRGKDALKEKVDTRSIAAQERKIDAEEAFNDKLGIGIDRLTEVLEMYAKLISSVGLKESSTQSDLEEIAKVDAEISQIEKKHPNLKVSKEGKVIDDGVDVTGITSDGDVGTVQEQEQRAEETVNLDVERNQLLTDILKSLGGEVTEKKGGILTTALVALKGGLAGALLLAGKIGTGLVVAVDAFAETDREYEKQGSALDNTLERFRLLSQNLVTAIPGLIDKIFGTSTKAFIDSGFKKLNDFGRKMGLALFDMADNQLTKMREFGEKIATTVTDIYDNTFGSLINLVKNAGSTVLDAFSSIFDKIKNIVIQKLNFIPGINIDTTPKEKVETQTQEKQTSVMDRISSLFTVGTPEDSQTESPQLRPTSISEKLAPIPMRVTSAADKSHNPGSKHGKGEAIDVTPVGFGGMPYNGKTLEETNPEAARAYENVKTQVESMGLKVIDEYSAGKPASKYGSARHMHIEGTKDKIDDLLDRSQVIESDVVRHSPNVREQSKRSMITQAQNSLDKTRKKPVTPISPMIARPTPIVVNTPKPTVIFDRDMDKSFHGWQVIKEMNS